MTVITHMLTFIGGVYVGLMIIALVSINDD